jgi:UDP-3-O-[3-hydroxymyristoyl] glucosamine N-acyltransferase
LGPTGGFGRSDRVSLTLEQLAERIGATIQSADSDAAQKTVGACASLDEATSDHVAFLANSRYAPSLSTTAAGAVIVGRGVEADGMTLLIADDPYFAFRNAVVALHGDRVHPDPAQGPISSQASVDDSATVGEGTRIHAYAVVSADAQIGKDCVLYPNTFVGPGAQVGDGCVLYPGVVIYDKCVLGQRVTLHAGCVIGQDGFGYATHEGIHHKIPQVGNVIIEDDVEMGAGCTIDRATIGSTIIGTGTKFSDMVAIGHGTHIGHHNLFVAQVGIAGSVETGDYVAMGGQAGVAGHLKIGSGVQVAAKSGVHSNIPDGEIWGGAPAGPFKDAKRAFVRIAKLGDLFDKVRKLERRVRELENE